MIIQIEENGNNDNNDNDEIDFYRDLKSDFQSHQLNMDCRVPSESEGPRNDAPLVTLETGRSFRGLSKEVQDSRPLATGTTVLSHE
ncbi:MAG: hypothetical protein AAB486_03410 [Patescibacteria group bacterium]